MRQNSPPLRQQRDEGMMGSIWPRLERDKAAYSNRDGFAMRTCAGPEAAGNVSEFSSH